jgi:hypothetical protein
MSPASRRRSPGCLSDLELDELAAGDLDADPRQARVSAHLATCAACSARAESLAAVDVPPPSADLRAEALRSSGRARGRRRVLAGAALAGTAAAAAALLLAWPRQEPDGERTKGGLALTLFVKRRGGAVERVQGEGAVAPGDELRFSLAVGTPGNAVVLGLDAAPAVTLYVPAGAAGPAARIDAPGATLLPGSVVADATAGAERVFAVLCAAPVDPQVVKRQATAALARAGQRPAAVSSLGTGCLETSVLLHKEAPPP